MLTVAQEQLDGMLAVLRRDLQRALNYRMAAVATAASGLFSIILFHFISQLVRVAPFTSPKDYFAFVVVGLIALQLIQATLYFPQSLLTQELVAGTFERLVVSPLGAIAGVIATMVFPFLAALAEAFVTLVFAALVFGIHLSWSTVALALPAALLAGLSFAPFGILFLAAGLLIKQVASLTGWVITVLSLLAGLYFPVALLPGWIRWASDVQPLTPTVDLMRNLLLGTRLSESGWLLAGRMAAFAAVLLPPAIWLLSWAVRVTRRRGTIIEY